MTATGEHPSIEALLYHAQQQGVLPITSYCNMGCVFCSNAYNPRGCEVFNIPPRSLDDISDTLGWLQGSKGPIVIGESVTRISEGEPFTHPEIIQVLRLVRKAYPRRTIRVTTNASLLTPEYIKELEDMGVELIVSLNSVGFRKEVMNDPDPERTLTMISLLNGKVKFEGSIVALPFVTGWDDIEESVKFLKDSGAALVRMLAPGFSRNHPLASEATSSLWGEIREFAGKVSRRHRIPVLCEPPLLVDMEPRVEEVLPGSPARKAGIKKGDIVREVSGRPVFSRVDAFELARDSLNPRIVVEREGAFYDMALNKEKYTSPGFVMYEDIREKTLAAWEIRSGARSGRNVLVLTSELAYPLVRSAVNKRELHVTVEPVPSRYFGGNIQAAGLLTVEDFLAKLEEVLSTGYVPDTVTVPSRAFDPWGRDLEGVSYRKIAETIGRPVILSE